MDPREAAARAGGPVTSRLQPGQRPPPRTQLQFSWNVPASSEKPPAQYADPRPIVIEKLKPAEESCPREPRSGDGSDLPGSLEFSVVSQEKLLRAVQLAKRDIRRRRHLEEQGWQPLSGGGEGAALSPRGKETRSAPGLRAFQPRPKDKGPPSSAHRTARANVYLGWPTRGEAQQPWPASPPTHDPGPAPVAALKREAERSTLEVWRLQKELQSCILKVKEDLARKERREMVLDPDEERRACVRRQEQSVRSARTLYVLQQQVKEIEEDLEKLSPHKVKHTKKSRAMARLAAAHRGATRALQAFMTHLANHPQPPPPSSATHVRQLGRLLRQLSLCSARLKMDCSVPEVIVDLLLQIEDLDSLLAKQASLALPPGDLPKNSSPRLPPQKEKVAVAVAASQPKKPAAARKLLPDEPTKPEEICPPPEANGAGGSPRALGELPPPQAEAVGRQEAGESSGPRKAAVGPGRDCRPSRKKAGVSFPTRPQGSGQPPRARRPQALGKQAHFQEATVSFRLKETKPPARESKPPWLPPSLSSPLSSPPRNPERSFRNKEVSPERGTAPGGKQGTPRKEAARAGNAGGSPAQLARQIEQAVRERLEPLLARAQVAAAAAATVASAGGVPDGGLGASAMEQATRMEAEPLLASGGLDLEAMWRRMEEMEHFQEAVRRRYHQVVYSDTLLEDAREEMRGRALGAAVGDLPEASGAPPPPIQITRVGSQREAQADIVLGRPLDAEAVEEEEEEKGRSPPEARGQGVEQPPALRHPPRRTGGLSLSIPLSVLQGIRDYGSRYERHLRGMAHEPVGSFDPWRITQSLAEELVEEALAEVATELQGLCEDYAEAVFTSEFLQAPE